MISADCPDKLCVHQHAISANGETIVCLPNKVVAEVKDGTVEIKSIAREATHRQNKQKWSFACIHILKEH